MSSAVRDACRIILQPRLVMRERIEAESKSGYRTLPALAGLVTAPSAAFSVAALVQGYDAAIWAGAIILSLLGFWMYVYVYGYAYRLIGGWFGAVGSNEAARLALAWTQVPFILLWLVILPLQILYRAEFFPEIDLLAVMGGSLDDLTKLLDVEYSTGFKVTNAVFYIGALSAWIWSLPVLGAALECPAWKAGVVKLIAVALHIPIFIAAAIPAFILALAIVILFPPG